ncbi:TPA: hypothetical protein ENG04_01145 [Candidatus Poribacteria bacterium]|nr:hypothetical protein [Candidatus Poribacteria bacterium]HEX28670.1 hypothetical protein [Candidatus Poribacteria bacterium]
MKVKQYLPYTFFGLGVIALLVPIIAYTCSPESDGITFDPDGGSKSAGNYNITVTWTWKIRSNHPNTNVTITVDPDDAWFKRKGTLWPDETIFSINPAPRNKTVGYNELWDSNLVKGDTVTLYANNTYYWEADDWSANCSLGWSTTYNGKRGSDVSVY